MVGQEGDDAIDRADLERELGDDPEVSPATSPQRPEEIWVRSRACGQLRPGGIDEPGGKQMVGSQAKLPRRDAVPAAHGQASDADRLAGARR